MYINGCPHRSIDIGTLFFYFIYKFYIDLTQEVDCIINPLSNLDPTLWKTILTQKDCKHSINMEAMLRTLLCRASSLLLLKQPVNHFQKRGDKIKSRVFIIPTSVSQILI